MSPLAASAWYGAGGNGNTSTVPSQLAPVLPADPCSFQNILLLAAPYSAPALALGL
jgi:hypothetical protein